MNENLRKELLSIARSWNNSGEFDGTEFEGRYFVSDDHLTEFAEENGFEINDSVTSELEQACNCSFTDYDMSKKFGEQEKYFGWQEVVFHD